MLFKTRVGYRWVYDSNSASIPILIDSKFDYNKMQKSKTIKWNI